MFRFACLFVVLASPLFADRMVAQVPPVTLDHPLFAPFLSVQSWDCSRRTCTQIRSCEEACHKLMVCGHTRRDGDRDGIPCENLCSRRC